MLHLAGLSFLAAASAGARQLLPDREALNYAHYDFFGRQYSAHATLHPEHLPMIASLLTPCYASRHGASLARLVQQRVLFDVVVNDFAAVASNACAHVTAM